MHRSCMRVCDISYSQTEGVGEKAAQTSLVAWVVVLEPRLAKLLAATLASPRLTSRFRGFSST